MDLADRTVLVTGATGGLGQEMARALRERGARLVLHGRRRDVLDALAEELGGEALAGDLADAADLAALCDRVGDVGVLIANAGLSSSGLLADADPEDLARSLDVNLRAPMLLARAAAAAMAQRRAGQIVLISSLSGMSGQPGSAIYSATKFGLRGFGQALRAELRSSGVGVSTILPGFVRDAGMYHDSGASLPWFIRTSSPRDVADAVVRAIEHDRPEIVVAPQPINVMTRFAAAAPITSAAVARLMGGDRITAKILEGYATGGQAKR